jgi:hypothetical protein
MKKTFLIFIQIWTIILLVHQVGFTQIPQLRRDRLILADTSALKSKQLKPQVLSSPLLVKKGFKLYSQTEFQSKINVNTDRLKRFTLKEFEDKERNGGKIPLQSPLFFQKNVGQANNSFKYILQNVSSVAGFYDKGFVAVIQKGVLNLETVSDSSKIKSNKIGLNFVGASGTLEPQKQIDGRVNRYIGREKEKWQTNIPSFNYLVNDKLYPGIRLGYQAKIGRIEYQFLVAPTAKVSDIKIAIEGIEKLSIDKKGNLVMQTKNGSIAQTAPKFYDVIDNNKTLIEGAFKIISNKEYGFVVTNHNPNAQLIIDPEIVFTSYFGGSANDAMLGADEGANDFIGRGFDVKIGTDGNVFIIGKTISADLPVTNSTTINGSGDVFVLRIDPSLPTGSSLVYATFIGGSNDENARSIEAMPDGSAYITGWSQSNDFPTSLGVVQSTREGSGAYVAKLSPEGDFQLGTFIGKSRSNHPNSIVFNKRTSESNGFIYVGGSTQGGSGTDATLGGFQTSHAGGTFDGFITKLNLALSNYEYFTYLGGTGRDVIMDIDVVDGFAFATGMTASKDFPTNDIAFQQNHTEEDNSACTGSVTNRACADAFVIRLNREGNELIYSTFVGEPNKEDYARGIAVNASKQAYITGASISTTENISNIFVAKLEGGGENILWKTTIRQGVGKDHGEELVVDQFDRAYVTGTISVDAPTTGQDTHPFYGGRSDLFYSRLSNDGAVEYFNFLGGEGEDRGFAIAAVGTSMDDFCVTIAGSTVSDNIETINSLNGGETRKGSADLLIYTICNVILEPNGSNFFKNAPTSVRRGNEINYTITLINGGDVPVPAVITDNVPSLITVTGVTGSGCSRFGNNITCSFQAQPGATTIVITGRVNSSANPNTCVNTRVTNTATIQVGSRRFSASAATQILCEPPLCGNGRLNPGEECDGSPGCRSNCTVRKCGDGIVDPGEECDNGRSNCVNCKITLRPDAECGSGVTGHCPSGTTCKYTISVVEDCWLFFLGCDSYVLYGGPYCLRN